MPMAEKSYTTMSPIREEYDLAGSSQGRRQLASCGGPWKMCCRLADPVRFVGPASRLSHEPDR